MHALASAAEHMVPAVEPGRGVYDADRAAALAGVPRSTLHYWAREGIYRPSISPDPRTRLWSWGDLLALRVIDWLRRAKPNHQPPNVSIRAIRQALVQLDQLGGSREHLHDVIAVSHAGDLFLRVDGSNLVRADTSRQTAMADVLRPVRPYHGAPDLLEPRPLLRIVPGKLHGEPHIVDTRIPSAAIYALTEAGYGLDQIETMYPEASRDALAQAIDLERSLQALAQVA